MWAAANYTSSRIGSQVNHPNNTDSDTSCDSEASDERSTTESIHDSEKANENSKPAVDEQKKRSQRRRRRKKKKRRREETPEAAMARLTTSYSAAMGAVGALHRVSRQIWRDNSSNKNEEMDGGGADMEVCEESDRWESSVDESEKTNREQDKNAQSEMPVSPDKDASNAASKLEEAYTTIEKVAQSARSSLEQSLLMDPIILAPILLPPSSVPCGAPKSNIRANIAKTDDIPAEQMTSAWWTVWNKVDLANVGFDQQASVVKWKKLSAAHKSTVKQIAYLSLVNYADLLLCGCSCQPCGDDILDRRPVKSLDALQLFQVDANTQQNSNCEHCSSCLWSNESREQTLRLALASYCDASELDPSDPTLWFKVACTARSLGRVVDSPPFTSSALVNWRPRSYRSLERLALERGLKSLPKGMPPNRMIMRAWREMEQWDLSGEVTVNKSDSVVQNESSGSSNQPIELVIHLPKYSWTTLGRILIRACKEGSGYGRGSGRAVSHVWSTNCKEPEDFEFGSPLIDIRISPVLCLSHVALRLVCEYLGKGSNDVKSLACTCKAISFEVQTATSTNNIQRDAGATDPDVNDGAKQSEEAETSTPAATREEPMPTTDNNQPAENQNATTKVTDGAETNTNASQASAPKKKRKKSKADDPFFIGRASKRVQSQMLSSEKESERQEKRSSVEYCFLAGTLACTSQDPNYVRLVKADYDWNTLPVLTSCLDVMRSFTGGKSNDALSKQTGDALLETSYSLGFFVDKARRNNSGPKHFLELFLLHVAMNPADVFGNNKGDLATCVLDCIDLLTSANQQHAELGSGSCWYGNEFVDTGDANLVSTIQAFSVNLLYAELRLRELHGMDLDSPQEGTILASNVPTLLEVLASISSIDSARKHERTLLELECRCYWLASAYYFWLSRCSSDYLASSESEKLGMDYLRKALKRLFLGDSTNKQSSVLIQTPHLQSSAREGEHWSALSCQSLSAYHEQLQSSSVVSRARREFLVVHQFAEGNLTSDNEAKLGNIGTELFEWYCKGNDTSKGNYVDIVKDFILHHQNLFEKRVQPVPESTTNASDWIGEFYWGEELWTCVPSSKPASMACTATSQPSRSSIIEVLICSLFATDKHISSNLVVFTKLTLASLELRCLLTSDGAAASNSCEEEARLHVTRQDEQFVTVANYFLDKLVYCLNSESCPESLDEVEMFDSEHMVSIIFESLRVLSADTRVAPSLAYIHLMQSLSQLMLALKAKTERSMQITSLYFVSLAKIFVNLRSDYIALEESDQDRRTKSWQSQVTRKADFVAIVANELAECLSLHPTKVSSDGSRIQSPLIKALVASTKGNIDDTSPFVKLIEASIWFWKHVNNVSDKTDSVRIRLLKPISAVIVSLCGVTENIRAKENTSDECCKRESFSDYFESDDSINGAFLHDEEEDDPSNQDSNVVLRNLSHAVQCISLVYTVAEKGACHECAPFMIPSYQHGPFLPLVTIRTLTSLSDNLFHLFSENVWGKEYPYGARSCGTFLDNILASAYRSVYGSLVTQNQTTDVSVEYFPESLEASSRLFRCIRRLYHSNRRSLPSRALEIIERTLPPSQHTPVSSAIHDFLFSARKDEGLSQLLKPTNFPDWILTESREDNTEAEQSEADRLRKMISSELAKGSITHLDSNQAASADEDGGCLSGERELTRNHEISLFNKFRAVLEDLSNDPRNIEGWVVLSETCGFKADIICDRLASDNQPFTASDFRPMPSSMRSSPANMELDELKRIQRDEFNKTREKWIPYLGQDLSVYIKYPWSSFNSLEACSKDIESKLSSDNSGECSLFKELEMKFEQGNYVAWARDWAGMFISALRTMKVRALCVARYLAKTQNDIDMHPSEVSEDIGTALYGDLVGSQSFGHPMNPMTAHEKREIAQHAKHFFEEAVELSSSDDYARKSETVLWENQFMIGKCLEKVASTLGEERFDGSDQPVPRNYETLLASAIQAYSSALADARTREQSGVVKTETGGSSHGSLEVLYRIHACRFKALLYAVRRVKEERNRAQLEALRIANLEWFDGTSSNQDSDDLRLRVWDAFVDCVKGLMQCRSDEAKFHRAHFRLAQAFNWAPLFCNPDSSIDGVGNECIPSMNDICIPGHETGSCRENAALIIENLFDKRRSQLCAVWVTTSTTPPPFEVLNDSVRKYDYLRLKYVKAFIDCMMTCRQKDKIENLLTNAMNSPQDLAGFYKASAAVRGGDPGRQNKQSLLHASGFIAEVKLTASRALAELILEDLMDLKRNGVDEGGKQLLEKDFKLANTLFLRLNSPPNEIVQYMRAHGSIIQVVVLCKCHISIQARYRINDSINFDDMDGETLLLFVEQALQRAKEMFPSKSKSQTTKCRPFSPTPC